MALEVARAVLPLPVLLIGRLALDVGAGGARVLEMRVDVGDVDHQSAARHVHRARRRELVLGRDAVEPDRSLLGLDLSVHHLTVTGTLDTPGAEPEHLDEIVVRGLDVLVHQDRDGALRDCHAATVAATTQG